MASQEQVIQITGFPNCPYYDEAVEVSQQLKEQEGENVNVKCTKFESKEKWHEHRISILGKLGHNEDYHKTCPFVYTTIRNQPVQVIGGCDSFKNLCRTEYKMKL